MFSRFGSYFYYEFYFLGTKYFLENILDVRGGNEGRIRSEHGLPSHFHPKIVLPKWPKPAQITKYNMDSSYQLESFLKQYQKRYGDQVSNSMSDKNQ